MRHLGCFALLCAAVLFVSCRPMPARAATPDQIDAAVAQGVAKLYAMEHNGNWERVQVPDPPTADPLLMQQLVTNGQWGGLTALSTLTLLAAGEDPKDPRLASAIDFLKQADLRGNYAVALRAQIWQYLDYDHSPQIKQLINRDAELLVDSVQNPGTSPGMYNYFVKPHNNYPWYDHSNSQIAVLGVWSLAETNVVEIPAKYWHLVENGWMSQQYPDGAWSYKFNGPTPEDNQHSLNMTSAGVATLYITQDYLRQDTGCTGNFDNPHIQAGIQWMIANYAAQAGQSKGVSEFNLTCYGLYGTERVGQASGRKYLGTIDWFKQGSDVAIGATNSGQIPDTCFALLFLVHGRAPVMLNKLEYNINMHGDKTKESNWNQRPADARRLARWTGRATELEFNWQIVNLNVPVDDLHDAPILYIAGDQDLDFTKDEEAKLKQFCEDGGLIMFNADCSSSRFSRAVVALGTKLFPQAEFRELPADHAIYTDEQFKRKQWREKLSVQGLSNGSRELMILFSREDPARYWQTGAYGGREDRHDIAADIFQYIAGDIQKLRKGRYFIVRPNGGGGGPPIKVARLQYAGNWDPEPGGWRRLSAILHNSGKAELTTETVKLGDGKLDGYKIAHLTGTYAYKFTDAARADLKKFVDGGGTLIVDSCGSSQAFAASMETEFKAIFNPAAPLPILPATNAVYAAGPKLEKLGYRRMTRKMLGGLAEPRLRGLEINGRVAIYFSPEDLSTGLVGVPCDGVYGYDSNTACGIMTDILLYANK